MSNSIPFDDSQITPALFCRFVPKRLEIPDRPELNDFPLNILFAGEINLLGAKEIPLALYEPDLSTYEVKDDGRELTYLNTYGADCRVRIIKKDTGTYWGVKIIQWKEKGFASGETWQSFFFYLGAMRLLEGEAFFTRRVSPPKDSKNKAE